MIGSIIPIADNWWGFFLFRLLGGVLTSAGRDSTENKSVKDGTYIGFLVLMICGGMLAWTLVPPQKIIRRDGTRVQRSRQVRMRIVNNELDLTLQL